MRRPRIAVAWISPDYRASLERAGADVRELRPDADALPAALDACDGVLLTGGVDVDPELYGETERHPTVEINKARDDYELALTRYALDRDMPLLAICRGAQVLNVAAGGTLVQDLPSQRPGDTTHDVRAKTTIAHDVTIAAGSCLARLLRPNLPDAGASVGVNSRHHQAVKDVAPGFVVSAMAPDGVIEAIERPDAAFCVGVQWHPENFWETGSFSTLFDGLVKAASASVEHREGLDVRGVGKQIEGLEAGELEPRRG